MESNDFKRFWDQQRTPVHAHHSDYWFRRYAEEIGFHLRGSQCVVDAGCGSGELLALIAPMYNRAVGIDYSPLMLEEARKHLLAMKVGNATLHADTITKVDQYVDQANAIYSNGVIQYLSRAELNTFLEASHRVLTRDGRLLLLNIPNVNSRILFMLGFFKHEKSVSFFRILKGLMRLNMKMVRAKLTSTRFDDGIGNWYSIEEIRTQAEQAGYHVEIYGSMTVNYYYRFHAILTKR